MLNIAARHFRLAPAKNLQNDPVGADVSTLRARAVMAVNNNIT